MIRFKTAIADGSVPNGRFYAGDFNMLEDLTAALTDFAQIISVSELKVGDAGLAIVKYGAGEFRLTGKARVDNLFRALGGLYLGSFTDAARNALPVADRGFGVIIENQTRGRFEWNVGTDVAPVWYPIAVDVNGNLVMPPGGTIIIDGVPIQNFIAPYPTEIQLIDWPPPSPVVNVEHYLRVAPGVLWHVRYDPADTPDSYDWEVLAGPSINVYRSGVSTASPVTTWVNLPDGALFAVAPRLGIYDVTHGAETYTGSSAAGLVTLNPGAGANAEYQFISGGPIYGNNSRKVFDLSLGTGQTVIQMYNTSVSGAAISARKRHVELIPKRIS